MECHTLNGGSLVENSVQDRTDNAGVNFQGCVRTGVLQHCIPLPRPAHPSINGGRAARCHTHPHALWRTYFGAGTLMLADGKTASVNSKVLWHLPSFPSARSEKRCDCGTDRHVCTLPFYCCASCAKLGPAMWSRWFIYGTVLCSSSSHIHVFLQIFT